MLKGTYMTGSAVNIEGQDFSLFNDQNILKSRKLNIMKIQSSL